MSVRAIQSKIAGKAIRPRNQIEIGVLIRQYKDADDSKWETNFVRGQLLDAMIKLGASLKYLCQELGIKHDRLMTLIKVYQAFPKDSDRERDLSWSHHLLALKSQNPAQTLKLAAKQNLTTSQLYELIYGEKKKRLSPKERSVTRNFFNMFVSQFARKNEITLPDWKDTLSVYIWWTKALKELSLIELSAAYSLFSVDDKDSQLAIQMHLAIDEEVERRKGDNKYLIHAYSVDFVLDRNKPALNS